MKFYSQKDPKWKHHKLGHCTDTFSQSGCKLHCVSSFTNKNPLEVNDILIKKNGYFSGCLIADQHTANILGIDFKGKMHKPPSAQLYPLIAEVRVGNIQHFVIMTDYDHIADPLDYPSKVKRNRYKVISYRLFKSKNTPMKQYYVASKLRTSIENITGKDRKKMDTKELQEKTAKDLNKATEKWEELELKYHELVGVYNNLSENYNESLELINKQRTEIQDYARSIKNKIETVEMQKEIIEGLEDENKKLKKELNSELLYKLKLGKLLIVIRKVLQV